MSVQNIGRNRWRVKVSQGFDPVTGKEVWFDKRLRGTYQEALDLEAERRFEARGTVSSRITLRALSEMWLADLAGGAHPREQNTIDYYSLALDNKILPVLGDVLLPALDSGAIEGLFASLPEGSVRVQARKTLSAMFGWAVRKKALAENPLVRCDISCGRGGRRRYDAFEPDEQEAILRAFRGSDIEAGVLVMLGEGARREEACAFDCEDYDPGTGSMYVEKAYMVETRSGRCSMKGPKNEDSFRELVFEGYVKERLDELLAGREGPIMRDSRGGRMRPDKFYRRFKAGLERAGIRYLPVGHLRHTYATRMIRAGVDLETLKQLMGHAKLSTIYERYVKSGEAAKARARKAAAIGLPDPGNVSEGARINRPENPASPRVLHTPRKAGNIIRFPLPDVTKTIGGY